MLLYQESQERFRRRGSGFSSWRVRRVSGCYNRGVSRGSEEEVQVVLAGESGEVQVVIARESGEVHVVLPGESGEVQKEKFRLFYQASRERF
jgi:hypothetical protein